MPNSHFIQIRCSSADVCERPSHTRAHSYLVTLKVLGVENKKDGIVSEVL